MPAYKITWWNHCQLDEQIYQTGYKNSVIFKDFNVDDPEVIEELVYVTNANGKQFLKTSTQTMICVASICDISAAQRLYLSTIKTHSHIEVTDLDTNISQAVTDFDITFTPQGDNCFSIGRATFSTKCIVNDGCCDNQLVVV